MHQVQDFVIEKPIQALRICLNHQHRQVVLRLRMAPAQVPKGWKGGWGVVGHPMLWQLMEEILHQVGWWLSNAIPRLFSLFVETLFDPLWCKFRPSAVWVTVTYHSKHGQVTGCIMCGKGNRNLANGLWVLTKPLADTTLIMHHKVCGFSNASPIHRKWLTKWQNQVAAYQAILADLHSGPPVMAKALKSLGERCLAKHGNLGGVKELA